ncbi:MAG: hypothetical protein U0Q16_03070 [Bryobacteraceae bacterium]
MRDIALDREALNALLAGDPAVTSDFSAAVKGRLLPEFQKSRLVAEMYDQAIRSTMEIVLGELQKAQALPAPSRVPVLVRTAFRRVMIRELRRRPALSRAMVQAQESEANRRHEDLMSERRRLVDKKFREGLSRSEAAKLANVDRQLDRLEASEDRTGMAGEGPFDRIEKALDRLEDAVAIAKANPRRKR